MKIRHPDPHNRLLPQMTQQFLAKMHAKKAYIHHATRPRLGDFFDSTLVQTVLIAAATALVAAAGITAWFVRPSSHNVILHYNAFFGVSDEMIGPWWYAYRPIALGGATLIVNTVAAFFLYRRRERIAAYILLLGAFLAQCAILIAAAAIAIVNRG